MEKLDLQIFRSLKQEVVGYFEKYEEAEERGEDISEEEQQQVVERYKEIIKILSEHDLSDIDFEEWRGMYLYTDENNPLDFSATKANLDFSIIEYENYFRYDENYEAFPNFKGCQIKNFNFKKDEYIPDMFDEEFRKENEGRFLSENISKDVANRFYNGELTLTDIQNNSELFNKIEEKNLTIRLRNIYRIIGREEFCKLDSEFIDLTTKNYMWEELLESNPNLRTAQEIMSVLYKTAREKIIGYYNDTDTNRFFCRQDELGERFKELNPDLFLDENAPEDVRHSYYDHRLKCITFSDNLQYFEGKIISQSFINYGSERKLVSLYGEDIYKLFTEYKPIIDKILYSNVMAYIEVPSGQITEEQRKEIMSSAIFVYLMENGYKQIKSWQELKMIQDFISLESLPLVTNVSTTLTPYALEMLEKYGIDRLIESGMDIKYLLYGEKITSLEEINNLNLKGIELEDIKKLTNTDGNRILDKYSIEQLLEYGIKDFTEITEISEAINDLHQLKDMLNKRPIDLINMGKYGESKKRFIEKYGIDNIIALDEETVGMFSHPMWENDIYLTLFANEENKRIQELDTNKKLTFEEFRDRMYEILLQARDEKGSLQSGDYPDYDFIQGSFREEYPEIFLDGNIDPEIKKKFYFGHMKAEDVRNHPELIQLLQGKDLSRVFSKKIVTGIHMTRTRHTTDGNFGNVS